MDISFGAPKELNFELVTEYPSANLFNGFWSDYVAEITDKDSALLSAFFRLTEVDIFNLDFSCLIKGRALWRLNRVEDYNPLSSEVTKVTTHNIELFTRNMATESVNIKVQVDAGDGVKNVQHPPGAERGKRGTDRGAA